MADIVGVRFRRAGKIYYFDAAGIDLKENDHVVVQTTRGLELGQVAIAPRQVPASEVSNELKPVVRKAEAEDIERAEESANKEKEAMTECSKLIAELNLPMRLQSAEYNLDGSRLTFCFTAEERVDFRKLVRELTKQFKTRIELRQIGPRDKAKLVGGLGRCGRPLCCANFLSAFDPVSIKMAKEQNLTLDPMKISGVCGRLLCCLIYENEQYRQMKERLPKKGQKVSTPLGVGSVVESNVVKETVLVQLESQASVEFHIDKIAVEDEPQPKQ